MSQSPKSRFLASNLKGKVLVITSEDKEFWDATENKAMPMDAITEATNTDTIILGEVLQRVDNPLEYLKLVKQKTKRIVLTVPNEWSWAPQNAPFKYAAHKHTFDAQSLGELLESAGLSYVMKSIDYSGWAFLGAEATFA